MSADADDIRERTRAQWSRAAERWEAAADLFNAHVRPVSAWMLDAVELEPGGRVLELACGAGQLGIDASERVAPGGAVLLTDTAEPMVEAAQRRALAAGAENVGFKVMDAEWIDEPTASFDAVLCRWGLMFPADPSAAARECRRVLKSGGRLAAAAWGPREENPWISEMYLELLDQGLIEPPDPEAPGPFRFAPEGSLTELLEGGGFFDIVVEPLDLVYEYSSFEDFWALHSQLSSGVQDALELTNDRGRAALVEGVRARMARFTEEDGSLSVPARPLMASASA
jgi:ubiquinone/menaquinone biosynthesis C-methylase UbiE